MTTQNTKQDEHHGTSPKKKNKSEHKRQLKHSRFVNVQNAH